MSSTVGSFDLQQYQAGSLGGLTVAEVRNRLNEIDGPLLIALAKRDGGAYELLPHPAGATAVAAADAIIVLATNEQAERMQSSFGVKQGR